METQPLGVLSEIKPTIVLSFKVYEIGVLTHLQVLPLALLTIFESLHLCLVIGEFAYARVWAYTCLFRNFCFSSCILWLEKLDPVKTLFTAARNNAERITALIFDVCKRDSGLVSKYNAALDTWSTVFLSALSSHLFLLASVSSHPPFGLSVCWAQTSYIRNSG